MPCVLITGASRGLGLAFTHSYAGDGWRVHATCRNPDKVEALGAKALESLSGDVTVHRLDVTDGLQVAALARKLTGVPIDLLLNNAGVYHPPRGFGRTDYDDWIEELRVNALAPLRVVERFVAQVAASERKLIVNISSGMGSIARTDTGGEHVYNSSKAALNMAVMGLSVDLAERGITVVALTPGWVRTDMSGPDADLSPEESVARMRAVIDRLTTADSGRFLNQDGRDWPW